MERKSNKDIKVNNIPEWCENKEWETNGRSMGEGKKGEGEREVKMSE